MRAEQEENSTLAVSAFSLVLWLIAGQAVLPGHPPGPSQAWQAQTSAVTPCPDRGNTVTATERTQAAAPTIRPPDPVANDDRPRSRRPRRWVSGSGSFADFIHAFVIPASPAQPSPLAGDHPAAYRQTLLPPFPPSLLPLDLSSSSLCSCLSSPWSFVLCHAQRDLLATCSCARPCSSPLCVRSSVQGARLGILR